MEIIITHESSHKIRFRIISTSSRAELEIAAGYGVLEYYDKSANVAWHIELMNVAPERKGYGSAILAEMLKTLRSMSITSCTTHPVSPQSLGFFKKHGFNPVPESDLWRLDFV